MDFFRLERDIFNVKPEIIFEFFGFYIANSTMLIFLIAFIFLFVGIFFISKFKIIPNNFQLIIEIIFEKTSKLIKKVTSGHSHTQKILPVILTILFYFVVSNIILIVVPGLSSITYNGTSIFRTPASDFNTVFGIALVAIIIINYFAIKEMGTFSYLGRFFKFKEVFLGFKKSLSKGFIALINFFVGLLEIISEFAKIISLSFRLFGNIYAGEVLSIVLLGSFIYVLPAMWNLYGGFIGILQAVIFAALIAAYYGLSVETKKKNIIKK